MPTTNTAAELLIRIGADPSNAEAGIAQFRNTFSRELGAVDEVAQRLAGQFQLDLSAVNNVLDRNRDRAQLWKTDLVASFAEVLNTSEELNNSLGRNFLLMDTALGRNIANAVIWQKSIGEAFRNAALQAIGAIAQEALVRAIYSTALGFYLLAIQDYRGAAQAFQSAAIYGAVGGTAALAGRALAGADVRQAEAGTTVRRPGEVAPELIVSGSGQQGLQTERQPSVQVIIQGPVYGGQAGLDELVEHINQAVGQRDMQLTASHVKDLTLARETNS
jgi:hypothetical protein